LSDFTYIDIFATKGVEYLLVIGFFLLLVGFWSFLNVPKKEIRKAQEEREELRRLLGQQHERMETEIQRLRDQRDKMQDALLAQLQVVEQKAIAAWHEAHPEQRVPTELGQLLDWVLAERDELVNDRKRLDYLTQLSQWKPNLCRTQTSEGLLFTVETSGKEFGEGATLRGAIDAARAQDEA
jgi:hypothetical protein